MYFSPREINFMLIIFRLLLMKGNKVFCRDVYYTYITRSAEFDDEVSEIEHVITAHCKQLFQTR